MATLKDLPNETVFQILSLVSTADVAHISCLSPRLHAVAEQLLYKAPNLSQAPWRNRNPPSLHRFLQTLLTPGRGGLGTHVRTLDVEWDRICNLSLDITSSSYSTSFHGPELVSLWPLLPSLSFLQISSQSRCFDFMNLMQSSRETLPRVLPLELQSLREFRYSRIIIPRIGAIPVMTLHKNIHSFSIRTTFDGEREVLQSIPNTAPTSSLTVSDYLSNTLLFFLLKDLTAVTEFSYTASVSHNFNFRACMRALEPLRNSIQVLKVNLSPPETRSFRDARSVHEARERAEDLDSPEFVGDGSFRTWPFLRRLSCPLMLLLGDSPEDSLRLVDVLPPSLERLVVRNDRYWLYEEISSQVVDLLGQKDAVVPNLASLGVEGIQGRDGRLAIACAVVSVYYIKEAETMGRHSGERSRVLGD